MKIHHLICTGSLALVLSQAAALAHAPDLPAPWALWSDNIPSGNYLAPLLTLQQALPDYRNTPLQETAFEYLGFYQSFVGDYPGAVATFDQLLEPQDWGKVDWRAGDKPLPAVATIVAEADKHQAIFINEAHHRPQHRALTTQLLAGLYAKGYRYFSAEALATDPELAQRGYPLRGQSGTYTDEPVFGDMLRTALKLGYKIVPYEDNSNCVESPEQTDTCQNQRERNQALHLQERIFKQDPKARVLVHAGYGHIEELESQGWKPMGSVFKELTGIDPWTFDQIEMNEHSAPRFESPFYANTLAHDPISQPTLFRKPDGSFWTGFYKGNYDALIVTPRSQYRLGRPNWLLSGDRRLQDLGTDVCPQLPCLVQAFSSGEDPAAVPRDQILISQAEPAALALTPGQYQIRVQNAAGTIIKSYALTVK